MSDAVLKEIAWWFASALLALRAIEPETRLTVVACLEQADSLTPQLSPSERGAARALCRAIHHETHAVLDNVQHTHESSAEWFVYQVARSLAWARNAADAPHATKLRILAILDAGKCLRNAEMVRRTMTPTDLALTQCIVAAVEEAVVETIHGAAAAASRKAA